MNIYEPQQLLTWQLPNTEIPGFETNAYVDR